MRLWLLALAVVALVAGVTGVVPALRHQARLQLAMLPRPGDADGKPPRDPIPDWLAASSETGLDFARARPEDPDLLLAAALIASDRDAAQAALRELTSSDGRPVVWSAYLDEILARTPPYYREETSGVDPGDTRGLAEVRRLMGERNLRAMLSADEAARVIETARGWQRADSDNALPVALEAWALWGLHRDEEALERWAAASRLPVLSAHVSERVAAVSRLLEAMGVPAPEATLSARVAARAPSLDLLAPCAFAAGYTGHLAEAAGEPARALLCWESTIDLGRHAQQTAESVPGFQAGAGLARLGAAPIWAFWSDSVTGRRSRGMQGGRYFYGPHHYLYTDRRAAEVDLRLVQDLAEADARLRMLQHLADRVPPNDPYARATEFLVFGLSAALLACGAAVLLPLVALGRPQAGQPGPPAMATSAIALAFACLVAAAGTSGVLLAVAPAFPTTPLLAPSAPQLLFAVGVPLVLVVALSLAVSAVQHRRDPLVRGRRTVQHVLLLVVVLGSLLYLVLGLLAMQARDRFLRQWRQPGLTNLQLVTRPLGRRWQQPSVFPESWETAPPPEAPPAEPQAMR